jgi:ABC-2 type transport system permease protein
MIPGLAAQFLDEGWRGLRKYLYVVLLGVQNGLVYRTNFLCRAVFNLVPLVAVIALWRAIYADSTDVVAGYTVSQMVSYYLLVTIIDSLTSVTDDDWQIATDIKDGTVGQFLVRPINYIGYRLCLFASGRLVFTTAAALPVLVFLASQREYFVAPPDVITGCCFMVSVLLSALIQFFISFTLASLAFWVLEISSFVFVLLALQRLLGGQMFPLDILPLSLQRIFLFTPFPYEAFFPASIYLGKMGHGAAIGGLLVQSGWVVLTWGLARLCWFRGVRNYAAVGG